MIKTHCEKCGNVEKYTTKEKIMIGVRNFLVALGIVIVLLSIVVGPKTVIESLSTSMMIAYSTNPNEHNTLREIVVNNTDCLPNDTFCYAHGVFMHINHLEYVPASIISPVQNPLYTYKHGGDCKNTALLYSTMLRSVGINARMVCSIDYEHCVTKVPYNRDKYFIVDLTYNEEGFWVMDGNTKFWDYRTTRSFII